MTDLSQPLPPFDPATPKPNSTINPPDRVAMTPTWDPSAPSKDAALTRIASAEVNGEFSAHPDGSNPSCLEAVAGGGHLDSDHLDSGGQVGERRRYPY